MHKDYSIIIFILLTLALLVSGAVLYLNFSAQKAEFAASLNRMDQIERRDTDAP